MSVALLEARIMKNDNAVRMSRFICVTAQSGAVYRERKNLMQRHQAALGFGARALLPEPQHPSMKAYPDREEPSADCFWALEE